MYSDRVMPQNVPHTHISVNTVCAADAIKIRDQLSYASDMELRRRQTKLRQWRKHRNRTLVDVAEHLGMTHGTLSKIERGKLPYNQELLEALADLYMCQPVDLLIRDPLEPDSIWSIWDQAKPGDRERIVNVARALIDGCDEPEANAA